MGQKVNPYGFRLGITTDWKSRWFADRKQYGENVIEDWKIRDLLMSTLPHAAISRTPRGEAQALVVNADNKVEARIVRAEQSTGDKWVVTEGLAAGDQVVVSGVQKIFFPGMPLDAKPQEAAAITNAVASSP